MEASLNTMYAPISAGLAPVGITTDQLPRFGNIVAYCSPYRLARTEATTIQLPLMRTMDRKASMSRDGIGVPLNAGNDFQKQKSD